MKKELTDLFKNSEISDVQNFNSIKITLASPEKIKSCTYGEIKNLKLSTTELLDLKKMVYFALEYLDLSKTMNVYVENIKEWNLEESYVKNVE